MALWNLFSSVGVLEVSLLELAGSRPFLASCGISLVPTRSESVEERAVAADKSMLHWTENLSVDTTGGVYQACRTKRVLGE